MLRLRLKSFHGSDSDYVRVLHKVYDQSDGVTAAHANRMGQYAVLIAEQLGLSEEMQQFMYFAGPLHDTGKLDIPLDILQKPGCFNSTEKALMNTHTWLGAQMLGGYKSPYLCVASEVALYHHEHWDGSGYPYGLSGDAIPMSARIVAICDVYDALRSRRPYKDSYSHDVALATIRYGDGRTMPEHFEPDVLAAFFATKEWFDEIYSGSLNV
jgi:putative two-component system response regulator